MTWRWTFSDPSIPASYTFEVNPNANGVPVRKKTITDFQITAADGAALVLFEGRDAATTIEWSGVIHTQQQYGALLTWFKDRHQLTVTDDLGRATNIYIYEFAPVRASTHSHPWRHTYTCRAYQVSG